MRTIKFRGIELESRNWVYGSLLSFDPIPEIQETEFDEGAYDYQRWEVEPESVGQFTGLTDKNGKEIYEGDIVKHVETRKNYEDDDYHLENRFSSQYYQHTSKSAVKYCDRRGKFFVFFHVENWNQVEIIGNLHENPELL